MEDDNRGGRKKKNKNKKNKINNDNNLDFQLNTTNQFEVLSSSGSGAKAKESARERHNTQSLWTYRLNVKQIRKLNSFQLDVRKYPVKHRVLECSYASIVHIVVLVMS